MSMEEWDGTKWEGAEALRPFLVEIDSLEPFPGNPRRGDVEEIRGSIRRFGQLKPIVVDGPKVVAGNHFRVAAMEEGYTHIAVLDHQFADDEARAFMLADNRTHDVGPGYDTSLLVEHLQHLQENSTLVGTGYNTDDLDAALAEMLRGSHEISPPLPPTQPADVVEVVLVYSKAQRAEFEQMMEICAHGLGTDGLSETVFALASEYARG